MAAHSRAIAEAARSLAPEQLLSPSALEALGWAKGLPGKVLRAIRVLIVPDEAAAQRLASRRPAIHFLEIPAARCSATVATWTPPSGQGANVARAQRRGAKPVASHRDCELRSQPRTNHEREFAASRR